MMGFIRNYKIQESYREESARVVDREQGVIRDVKVLGKVSRNGREYSQEAIEKASHLYEGAKVNIDHIDPRSGKASRSYPDGIGELRNVVVSADGLRADLHYNREHPFARKLAEDAERFPRSFGLSHDADGQARKTGKKTIVESIDRVNSVDIVGSPATNSGLFESEESPMKVTIRSLVESFADAAKKPILAKRLTEMEGDMPAMMDAPVEAPEGEGEDQIAAAFKAMVVGVLDDKSLDVQGKLAKIKLILQSEDKLMNGTAPAAAESDKPADGEGGTQEAFKAELGKLLESSLGPVKSELADLRIERVLEAQEIEPTAERVKAYREAKDDAAKSALVEGWKPERRFGPRPTATGRKVTAGTTADAESARAEARKAFGLKS